jgi:Fe-S cluster assembly protein SufD
MTAVATKTLREYFSRAEVEALSAKDPAWLRQARLKGWQAWEEGTKNNEALASRSGARWLAEARIAPNWALVPGAAGAMPETLKPSLSGGDWGELAGCRSFGNGEELGSALSDEAAKAGVVFCSLKEALKSHEALLKQHLFSRTTTDETSFAGLNAAYFGDGSLLFVPKGVKLSQPLRNIGVHRGGQAAFFPRTLVLLEDGAEVTLIDELHSATADAGFCTAASELVLGKGSKLSYINFQNLNLQSGMTSRQTTVLGREAYLYTLGILCGSAWSSTYIGSVLEGEGAHVDLLGLLLAGGTQKTEIRTLQDHIGRAGESDALVKSILRGHARSYFDGVVRIFKTGQNSNAFQSNPNLLLSSDARAESVPTLEIEADDVACKHAASIGSINEEEKFYLLSRGISEEDTESMIVEGFAAELASRLPSEHLQEQFAKILNRLASPHA